MTTFTYMAYDSEGIKVYGCKSFSNEAAVKDYLDKRQLSDYKIFESKTKYSSKHYGIISPKELSVFCSQISVLFFSQITFMEGVLLISEQAENKSLKQSLKEVHSHMNNGFTFAEAMGMYEHIFGKYLLNMVFIGEESGTLDSIFATMSDYFDKEDKARKKIKSAVTYPAILAILMGSIVLLLVLRILPMFQETLSKMGHDIPEITKIILGASNFINNYLIYFVAAILILIISFSFYRRTEKGKAWFDKMKLKLPVSRNIYAKIITARLSKGLSILLKSGIHLINALDQTRILIDNSYIERKYAKSISKIRSGGDLIDSLGDMKVFPPLFLKIVMIGQSTGHLDEMLKKAANVFEDEVDESLERFRIMIEPLLIIILSVIVGIILVSIMLPMISIMNNIG